MKSAWDLEVNQEKFYVSFEVGSSEGKRWCILASFSFVGNPIVKLLILRGRSLVGPRSLPHASQLFNSISVKLIAEVFLLFPLIVRFEMLVAYKRDTQILYLLF